MHTVIETAPYLKAADAAGMTEGEREAFVTLIAQNPIAGDEIVGTGGCRKIRLAGRGKGKSGGYRIITYFGGHGVPVFLLTVFSKGDRADLTQRERNDLRQLARVLVKSLRQKVVRLRKEP